MSHFYYVFRDGQVQSVKRFGYGSSSVGLCFLLKRIRRLVHYR